MSAECAKTALNDPDRHFSFPSQIAGLTPCCSACAQQKGDKTAAVPRPVAAAAAVAVVAFASVKILYPSTAIIVRRMHSVIALITFLLLYYRVSLELITQSRRYWLTHSVNDNWMTCSAMAFNGRAINGKDIHFGDYLAHCI